MPYASNADIRIHYELEGDGPPLVLHTGFCSSVQDCYTLGYLDALKTDYQLVLLDPQVRAKATSRTRWRPTGLSIASPM